VLANSDLALVPFEIHAFGGTETRGDPLRKHTRYGEIFPKNLVEERRTGALISLEIHGRGRSAFLAKARLGCILGRPGVGSECRLRLSIELSAAVKHKV
jgi:hypothetical protein